jgi:hypothetical protein
MLAYAALANHPNKKASDFPKKVKRQAVINRCLPRSSFHGKKLLAGKRLRSLVDGTDVEPVKERTSTAEAPSSGLQRSAGFGRSGEEASAVSAALTRPAKLIREPDVRCVHYS